MKAIWHGAVLAESNDTVVVEGNHYFPPESIKKGYFRESKTHTTCSWKGVASYYDIVVNGEVKGCGLVLSGNQGGGKAHRELYWVLERGAGS